MVIKWIIGISKVMFISASQGQEKNMKNTTKERKKIIPWSGLSLWL
jgi:hypothetical protein